MYPCCCCSGERADEAYVPADCCQSWIVLEWAKCEDRLWKRWPMRAAVAKEDPCLQQCIPATRCLVHTHADRDHPSRPGIRS